MIQIKNIILVTITTFLFSINCSYTQRILTVGLGKVYNNPQDASRDALPGDTILIFPGNYPGGNFIENLRGTRNNRITLRGVDKNSVIFNGGSQSFHFVEAEFLTIQNFTVSGQTGNGMNIDDAGTYETPAKHILIENINFKDMNASGNNDMLKLSGLDSFEIRNCTFSNGSAGGSGIDMVGCHYGEIRNNKFINQGSNSIQAKGGTHSLSIYANSFQNGGQRSLNLGGSTGQAFFRPLNANYEAKDIIVHSNFFQGSDAPIAYVGSRNIVVTNNTFVNSTKWIFRILQESPDTSFYLSTANNTFSNNIIYSNNLSPTVNIGPYTSPNSFNIFNNLWYNSANSSWRGPTLPVVETGAIYGLNPLFLNLQTGNINLSSNSPAIGKGKGPVNYNDYYGRKFTNPPAIGASEYDPNTTTYQAYYDNVINIFPNPARSSLYIQSRIPIRSIQVYNLDGKLLHVKSNNFDRLDLTSFDSGIYCIKLIDEKNEQIQKVFIKI
ncbi:MAG: right-handed parallel beta-helix repeat-containing protein [Saprospiraceae bacterium]|nr:right-handed parallel beta-helix repeat-containing protein [Saprospiraceae bacterium]